MIGSRMVGMTAIEAAQMIQLGTVALTECEARCSLSASRRSDREGQFRKRLGETRCRRRLGPEVVEAPPEVLDEGVPGHDDPGGAVGQQGRSVIPKSTKPSRIAENIDVFDFELSADEMAAIDGLDSGRRGGPEPDAITLAAFGREIPEA